MHACDSKISHYCLIYKGLSPVWCQAITNADLLSTLIHEGFKPLLPFQVQQMSMKMQTNLLCSLKLLQHVMGYHIVSYKQEKMYFAGMANNGNVNATKIVHSIAPLEKMSPAVEHSLHIALLC